MLEYGTRMISSLLISSVLAKSLGVAEYGVFQYSLNVVVLFSAISFICGAEVLVPKLVNASSKKRKKLLDNAFILRLTFSIIGYLCLVIYSFFLNEEKERTLTLILGLIIILSEPFHVITAYFQSQTNIKPKVVISIVSSLIKTIIVIFLFKLGYKNSIAFSLAWVLDCLLIAFSLSILYYRINQSISLSITRKNILYLLKRGLPFFYSLLAMYLFTKLDFIFLKAYSNNHELGIYAASFQITSIITATSAILAMSLAPTMIYAEKDSRKTIKNLVLTTIIMVLISLTLAIIISPFSEKIVTLMFGKEYINSISILKLQSFALVFVFIDAALNLYFIKYQKGNLLLPKWILACVSAAISFKIFIPNYGAMGAIAGYAIGYMTACGYSLATIFWHYQSTTQKNKLLIN